MVRAKKPGSFVRGPLESSPEGKPTYEDESESGAEELSIADDRNFLGM